MVSIASEEYRENRRMHKIWEEHDMRLAEYDDQVVGVEQVDHRVLAQVDIYVRYLPEEAEKQFLSLSHGNTRACVYLGSGLGGGCCRSISAKNITILAYRIHYKLKDGRFI